MNADTWRIIGFVLLILFIYQIVWSGILWHNLQTGARKRFIDRYGAECWNLSMISAADTESAAENPEEHSAEISTPSESDSADGPSERGDKL